MNILEISGFGLEFLGDIFLERFEVRKSGFPFNALCLVPIFAEASPDSDLIALVFSALVQFESFELLLGIVSILFGLMPDILPYVLMVS